MDSNHDVMGRLQWCSHYFSNSTMQEKDNQQRVSASKETTEPRGQYYARDRIHQYVWNKKGFMIPKE
jgi:hypothetical protein